MWRWRVVERKTKEWGRCVFRLTQDRLVFTLGSVVAMEAAADALSVVAEPSAGAVAARFVAVALHDVSAGGALEQRAVGPPSAQIAHAPHLLLRIPRRGVYAAGLDGKLLL